ncbi:MAG: small basic protein [Thermodesulfobacteriota bacterium]
MSIDKSLVSKGKLVRHRSVLTRTERVQHLTDEGLWDETKSVYGLPKVKTIKVKKKAKVAKEKTEETADATATAATTGDKEKDKGKAS